MAELASSWVYANDGRDPVPPAPPVAPSPLGLVVWGTVTVVAGVLLCVVGPVVVLAVAPGLRDVLGVTGWVDGLLTAGAVASAVVTGVALVTLGRGVRALAWLVHRALEEERAGVTARTDPT